MTTDESAGDARRDEAILVPSYRLLNETSHTHPGGAPMPPCRLLQLRFRNRRGPRAVLTLTARASVDTLARRTADASAGSSVPGPHNLFSVT